MTGTTTYPNRHTAILTLKERVDALTAAEFRQYCESLFASGITHFVIDLSQTPVIDSAGIAVLVNIFKHCRQAGGAMKLTKAMSPAAAAYFTIDAF
ncbi:MAG: STAS domain-containing protein [Caldilineaceae bacterium]